MPGPDHFREPFDRRPAYSNHCGSPHPALLGVICTEFRHALDTNHACMEWGDGLTWPAQPEERELAASEMAKRVGHPSAQRPMLEVVRTPENLDVTAPIPGESQEARVERVMRHISLAHPDMEMLDPAWLEHPLQAHEAIHQARPEDLPGRDEPLSTAPDTLSNALDTYQGRIKERLSEMLGSTLQPIVIDAIVTQIGLTTRAWLRELAYEQVPDTQEHYAFLRAAEAVIQP